MESAPRMEKLGENWLKGIAVSPGIAIGKVCVHNDVFAHIREGVIQEGDISPEISRMEEAVSIVQERLKSDHSCLIERGDNKNADIFSAHISILEDSHFLDGITSRIAEKQINAQTALIRELHKYERFFSRIQDPYLKGRIVDLRDIARRLIQVLAGPEDFDCPFDEAVVVAAKELTPYDTIRFKPGKVLAFITEQGGRESHAAILARSMRISAVVGIHGLLSRVKKGDFLIVDGNMGFVLVNPRRPLVEDYQKIEARYRERRHQMEALIPFPARTRDGTAIMAEKIVREVDFLSIGTNDLVQYTLAVDRDNDLVSRLYQSLNPAVIWLIKRVVDAAVQAKKPVSICGEIAGDPLYTPLLIGLGLRELSITPTLILDIKKAVLSTSLDEAKAVADIGLTLSTVEEVQKLLETMKEQSAGIDPGGSHEHRKKSAGSQVL